MINLHMQSPRNLDNAGAPRSSTLNALPQLAKRSGARLLTAFVALFGYSLGGGLVFTAFLKSFFPRYVGAWTAGGNLVSIGFTSSPPAGAHELLGPHYLALALTAGAALLAGTHSLSRRV